MSRLKVKRIQFYVLLFILVSLEPNIQGRSYREKKDAPQLGNNASNIEPHINTHQQVLPLEKKNDSRTIIPHVKDVIKDQNNKTDVVLTTITSKSLTELNNGTTQTTASPKQGPIGVHPVPINPGALLRGFYVFLGLTVILMAYIVFRSFRLSKSRTQMVRKYGVLAHRQDVEMRPLPLDEEDDEDTTVFDVSNISADDNQRQIL